MVNVFCLPRRRRGGRIDASGLTGLSRHFREFWGLVLPHKSSPGFESELGNECVQTSAYRRVRTGLIRRHASPFEHAKIMNRVSHFIALAAVGLCFSTVSKGGEIQFTMQPIGQVVRTTTTKTLPSEIIISEDGIRAIGTRYQLLKTQRDKVVYRDLQTGHTIKIETHD
jgi:hypothetical protein